MCLYGFSETASKFFVHNGPNTGSNNKETISVKTQYNFLAAWLKAQTKDERGAAMVEYALLLALIAIVAIAALGFLGGTVRDNFSDINSALN